jgi:hypothetical protein
MAITQSDFEPFIEPTPRNSKGAASRHATRGWLRLGALRGSVPQPVPDRCECREGRRERRFVDTVEYLAGDLCAQRIEIVNELSTRRGQVQEPCASVLGIKAALDEFLAFQPVKQARQRDRLQLEHLGERGLIETFRAAQTSQHAPLRAGRAIFPCALVDIAAQLSGGLEKLENEFALEWAPHAQASIS